MNLEEILERAGESMTARRVFGDPVERNGVTVVPVAALSGGGGGGGGASEGGAGFGMRARPVGAFVIQGDQVAWQPALDVSRLATLAAGGLTSLLLLRSLRKLRRS